MNFFVDLSWNSRLCRSRASAIDVQDNCVATDKMCDYIEKYQTPSEGELERAQICGFSSTSSPRRGLKASPVGACVGERTRAQCECARGASAGLCSPRAAHKCRQQRWCLGVHPVTTAACSARSAQAVLYT